MKDTLRESLDRTLLLMRDEVTVEASDLDLLQALTSTTVILTSDAANIASPAAQCAFVTAALLIARSGHRVHILAPDVPLIMAQPPLRGDRLVSSLEDVGKDLLFGIEFSTRLPKNPVDLCVTIGDSPPDGQARVIVSMNATAWAGMLKPMSATSRWVEPTWPLGGHAAAALAAGEAFKVSMRKLRRFARAPRNFEKLFASNTRVLLELAPETTVTTANLGAIDFVSGGAITHAALYSILRLPRLCGTARIIENTGSDHSNLNRYALLRSSDLPNLKGETLREFSTPDFRITASNLRFEASTFAQLQPLAPKVLVGVDHVPTRWFVQESAPNWLGIGASTHWSAMASYHQNELACARCLHPLDDDNDAPIPTVSFVSFWAGLLLITYLLRAATSNHQVDAVQHVYLTPLRPESIWWGPVPIRESCPLCRKRRAA
jgi:hypothetical protein